MESGHSRAQLGEEAQEIRGSPAKAQWRGGSMLREAFKAFLRGQAQVLTWVERKEMRLQRAAMEREVVEMEGLALASGDPEDQDKLKLRQQELQALAENYTRKYATGVHRRLYKVRYKAGKLLACLERRDRERAWVLKLENAGDVLQILGAEIAETFADYYEHFNNPQIHNVHGGLY
ncbi:hypothetical protein NDU88_003374 [Pleurodeles waltl]|uniref:Uncharacterized protein n=1 Tax=Pleurodeles waltl TaxID=8319 RepID=A0AAV7SFL6_PLEWA|nr:hypothetical protein NDU88_003374 [Pleurodeles waltl]